MRPQNAKLGGIFLFIMICGGVLLMITRSEEKTDEFSKISPQIQTNSYPIFRMGLPAYSDYQGGLYVKNNTIYMGLVDKGFVVAQFYNGTINVTDAILPGLNFNDIIVIGNYAYIAGGSNLFIVDVTNIYNLTLTRILSVNSYHMVLNGQFLYVVGGDAFQIINVNDPQYPIMLGKLTLSSIVVSFALLNESIGFAMTNSHLIVTLNINNKNSPYATNSISYGYLADGYDMQIFENHLYVCGQPSGGSASWLLYDISNPSTITLKQYFNSGPCQIDDLQVVNETLFFAATGCEFQIYNVSNSNNITQIDTTKFTGLPDSFSHFYMDSNWTYILGSEGSQGLYITATASFFNDTEITWNTQFDTIWTPKYSGNYTFSTTTSSSSTTGTMTNSTNTPNTTNSTNPNSTNNTPNTNTNIFQNPLEIGINQMYMICVISLMIIGVIMATIQFKK